MPDFRCAPKHWGHVSDHWWEMASSCNWLVDRAVFQSLLIWDVLRTFFLLLQFFRISWRHLTLCRFFFFFNFKNYSTSPLSEILFHLGGCSFILCKIWVLLWSIQGSVTPHTNTHKIPLCFPESQSQKLMLLQPQSQSCKDFRNFLSSLLLAIISLPTAWRIWIWEDFIPKRNFSKFCIDLILST